MLRTMTCIGMAFLVVACAPPPVRGTFMSALIDTKPIVFPLNQVRTSEVGEATYEQGEATVTRERKAKILAPVTANLELGHSLKLATGAGGPLLTRSEGGEPALCFATSGVGQAVTIMSASGVTIACLVDTDKDGTFDYSMFATREKYFDLPHKVPYSVTVEEKAAERKGALRVDFIYQGFARGVLRFSYREFRDGLARPAFTQDLTYEADSDGKAVIGFKGMRMQVLKATNQNVTYIVERQMTL